MILTKKTVESVKQQVELQNQPLRVDFLFAMQSMPIFIGHDVHQQCIEFCVQRHPDRLFFIADSHVWNLHNVEILSRYRKHFEIDYALVEPSERCKTLEQVNHLLEMTVAAGVTRRSIIMALGGGLTGNIAGMVAGLLYRGIPLVHLPDDLIAK